MGSPRLNDVEASTTVRSVPPVPSLLLFPCLVFPLYPHFNSSLWVSPAFTSESLQTIEPLMRSDGQMERRRGASDRALADPAALELRWGQTLTVKSHLGICSCRDRRRLSRNLDSVISLCGILFFKHLHSWLSKWINTKSWCDNPQGSLSLNICHLTVSARILAISSTCGCFALKALPVIHECTPDCCEPQGLDAVSSWTSLNHRWSLIRAGN